MPACECYVSAVVIGRIVTCRWLATDCLSNFTLAREGSGRAKAATHPYARVWHVFFAAADEWTREDLLTAFVWMPAHKTAATFGSYVKSNCEAITFLDWLANRAADKLAEMAATTHQVPLASRAARDQIAEAWRYGMAKAGRATERRVPKLG